MSTAIAQVSDDRVETRVKAAAYFGDDSYWIEVSRSQWSEDALLLEIKAGGGLDIKLTLQREVIDPLIEALYRAKLWTPIRKEDGEAK